MEPLRLGVLASHGGTTLQAVMDACEAGLPDARVVVVISNNRQSGAMQRARHRTIASAHLSDKTHPKPYALDAAIAQTLQQHQVNLVLLAGYMKKLGKQTLYRFQGRILNTHPALLPTMLGSGAANKPVKAGEPIPP